MPHIHDHYYLGRKNISIVAHGLQCAIKSNIWKSFGFYGKEGKRDKTSAEDRYSPGEMSASVRTKKYTQDRYKDIKKLFPLLFTHNLAWLQVITGNLQSYSVFESDGFLDLMHTSELS